jgi:hypothetical protein
MGMNRALTHVKGGSNAGFGIPQTARLREVSECIRPPKGIPFQRGRRGGTLEHTLESLLAAGRNGEMTADDLWEAVMTVDRSAWTREDYAELTELFYSLGGKRVANAQRAVWETVPYGRAHR